MITTRRAATTYCKCLSSRPKDMCRGRGKVQGVNAFEVTQIHNRCARGREGDGQGSYEATGSSDRGAREHNHGWRPAASVSRRPGPSCREPPARRAAPAITDSEYLVPEPTQPQLPQLSCLKMSATGSPDLGEICK